MRCVSLFLAVTSLTLGSLELPTLPALWTIPTAFLCTLLYHVLSTTLPLSAFAKRWKRPIAAFNIFGAYVLAGLWTAAFAMSIMYTAKLAHGKDPASPDEHALSPFLITASILCFFQPIIFVATGVLFQRQWMQEQYRDKWQWKIQINSSTWRSVVFPVRGPSHGPTITLTLPLYLQRWTRCDEQLYSFHPLNQWRAHLKVLPFLD